MKRKDKLTCAYLRLCELNNMLRCNDKLEYKKELQLISIVLSEILDLLS